MATEYDGIIAELIRIGDLIEAMCDDALSTQTAALASLAQQAAALEGLDLTPPPVPEIPPGESPLARPFVALPGQTRAAELPGGGRLFIFAGGGFLRWTAEGFTFCGLDGQCMEIVFTETSRQLPDGTTLTLDGDHACLIQPELDPGEEVPAENPAPTGGCAACGLSHEGGC